MKMKLSQIVPILIAFLVVIGSFLAFIYSQVSVKKELELISPNGGEVWRAGETYTITWKSKKIDKVDIVLVKEGEQPKKSKIIVKNFPAKEKKYKWQIFAFEEPSDRYKIAIFESPWQEGNKIDYSNSYFSIVGPKFVSCEQLEITEGWIFLPSDYPNLKRIFITENTYSGNLGGLEGADKICQEEAKKMGFEGNWKAFLGDDNISASERLKLDGIFVYAKSQEGLPQDKIPAYFWQSFEDYLKNYTQGNEDLEKRLTSAYQTLTQYFSKFYERWNLLQKNKGCVKLLGKDFQQFYKRLFLSSLITQDFLQNQFFEDLFRQEIWVGRVFPEDKKTCINIFSPYEKETPSTLSFTPTCQNWMIEKEAIEIQNEKENLPQCYTSSGAKINALGIGGGARIVQIKENEILSEISGKKCSDRARLLCIEQPPENKPQ